MKEKIVGSANKFVGKMSYLLNEMAFVYPITPSSLMGEIYENMSAQEIKNIYDGVGKCVEMQSEAGVAGALHGALLSGSIATTYSSSQGLLLMIPNMYKIAGECLPCVINVATRSLATHALNIFCDHSDIYAARYTGFAMLSSNSVQEAYDFALIAQIATYKTSIPFIHFFDGFRTSHEIRNIEEIANDDIKKMLPYTKISDFKNKAMSPSKNNVFGMVQNHDTFFQNSLVREHKYEKINTYLNEIFDEFYQITGRKYRTVEYFGSKKAEEVIITFSSAAEIVEEVIEFLNYEKKDVGLIKIRSLNPLDTDEIIKLLPKTVKKIVVLERIKDFNTKTGPLYNELVASLSEEKNNIVFFSTIYGLGGKELKFDNILSIFENLWTQNSIKNSYVGINDDVNEKSLPLPIIYKKPIDSTYNFSFFGMTAEGIVSSSKILTEIISEYGLNIQGYNDYDAKKSGSVVSLNLRFSKNEFKKPYMIDENDFLIISNFRLINQIEFISKLKNNSVLLINTAFDEKRFVLNLKKEFISQLIEKNINVYIIDAYKIAKENNLGKKINNILVSIFLNLCDELNNKKILALYLDEIKKIFPSDAENNINAVDSSLAQLKKISNEMLNDASIVDTLYQNKISSYFDNKINDLFYRQGDKLPVSEFSSEKKYRSCGEKNKFNRDIIFWDSTKCVQCGKCNFVCPNSSIKSYLYDEKKQYSYDSQVYNFDKSKRFAIQCSPYDCLLCKNCINICPVGALRIIHGEENIDIENNKFEKIEQIKLNVEIKNDSVNQLQFANSYFNYPNVCQQCGETQYIKLLSKLYGNSLVIANATGCSSIYGGTYGSVPYTPDENGFGISWANSLFEDNGEFGYGILLSKINQKKYLLNELEKINNPTINEMLEKYKNTTNQLEIKKIINELSNTINDNFDIKMAEYLNSCLQNLYLNNVWIVGGDGWAYDIGFGGIDHILNSNEKIRILILDNEVYANTGGQMSKSTPRGAKAKYATNGKTTQKKDMAKILISLGNVYVAQVCLAANMQETINIFKEANEFEGPSVIIAYAPCAEHRMKESTSCQEQIKACADNYVKFFKFNPKVNKIEAFETGSFDNYDDFIKGEKRFANDSSKEDKK